MSKQMELANERINGFCTGVGVTVGFIVVVWGLYTMNYHLQKGVWSEETLRYCSEHYSWSIESFAKCVNRR